MIDCCSDAGLCEVAHGVAPEAPRHLRLCQVRNQKQRAISNGDIYIFGKLSGPITCARHSVVEQRCGIGASIEFAPEHGRGEKNERAKLVMLAANDKERDKHNNKHLLNFCC